MNHLDNSSDLGIQGLHVVEDLQRIGDLILVLFNAWTRMVESVGYGC